MRFLLGLMFVVAVGAAYVRVPPTPEERQEHAFQKLTAKGFTIIVGKHGTKVIHGDNSWLACGTFVERSLAASEQPEPFTDADLELFDDILNLELVLFADANVTPEGRALLERKYPQCRIK